MMFKNNGKLNEKKQSIETKIVSQKGGVMKQCWKRFP